MPQAQIAQLIPPSDTGDLARFDDDDPLDTFATSAESAADNAHDGAAGPQAQLQEQQRQVDPGARTGNAAEAQDHQQQQQQQEQQQQAAPRNAPLNVWQSRAGVFKTAFPPPERDKSGHGVTKRAKDFHGVAAVLLALSFRWTLQTMLQMAKGVLLAHRANVVHGDVRLSNFMWGDWGRVKLMDFDRAARVRSARLLPLS